MQAHIYTYTYLHHIRMKKEKNSPTKVHKIQLMNTKNLEEKKKETER